MDEQVEDQRTTELMEALGATDAAELKDKNIITAPTAREADAHDLNAIEDPNLRIVALEAELAGAHVTVTASGAVRVDA